MKALRAAWRVREGYVAPRPVGFIGGGSAALGGCGWQHEVELGMEMSLRLREKLDVVCSQRRSQRGMQARVCSACRYDATRSWVDAPCTQSVEVHATGHVNLVHQGSADPYFRPGSQATFRVRWVRSWRVCCVVDWGGRAVV